MKQIAATIGLICLAYAGCASQLTQFVAWKGDDSLQIVVWNGTTCVETTRTPEQLGQMQRLTRIIVRPDDVEMDAVFLENVEPAKRQELLLLGATIVLPSGKSVAFPPMKPAYVDGVVRNGVAQFASGASIPVNLKNAEGLAVIYRVDDLKNIRGVDFDFATEHSLPDELKTES